MIVCLYQRLGLDIDDPENATPHFKDSEDFYFHASFNRFGLGEG